jgi:quercetin dioxygenase-like cupin family protein
MTAATSALQSASFRAAGKRATLAAIALAVSALGPAAPRGAIDWFADLCGHSDSGETMLAAVAPTGDTASRPASRVKVLSCEALPNVPGKSMTTAIVEYPPLGYTPAHRHPGSVTAVVLEGTVRSELQGGPAVTYTSGQTWFEPPGTLHLFAENPDPHRPARLLATFVADTNCGPLVLSADHATAPRGE